MYEENKVSEWNEANLKMKRLHDAQERINFFKRDPKGITQGKFNYEWWVKDVEVLYGEGKSKYSDSEKAKVDRIKQIIVGKLRFSPPHARVAYDNVGSSQFGFVINQEEYVNLIILVDEFEDLVKDYNDKHGLSTKNKIGSGLF